MMIPFTLAERQYVPTPQLHTHSFYQIIFPRQGALHLMIEGQAGAVDPLGWAVIHPTMAHYFWADPSSRFLIADLPTPTLAQVAAQFEQPHLPQQIYLPLGTQAAALRDLLASEITSGELPSPLVADTLATYTASLLVRQLTRTPAALPAPTARLAQRTRDYLHAHVCTPLRLEQIAAAVGASTAHLQRSFRATYGLSIVAYLHAQRMHTAQQLLITTDQPIHAIAAAVGFSSQSAFTRLFVRTYGISPRRYRAQHWAESGKSST
jgi:AraC-like DNA-binding protein